MKPRLNLYGRKRDIVSMSFDIKTGEISHVMARIDHNDGCVSFERYYDYNCYTGKNQDDGQVLDLKRFVEWEGDANYEICNSVLLELEQLKQILCKEINNCANEAMQDNDLLQNLSEHQKSYHKWLNRCIGVQEAIEAVEDVLGLNDLLHEMSVDE